MDCVQSVIVIGHICFQHALNEGILERLLAAQSIIQQEPGCLEYRFSWDISDEKRINISEIWQDDSHLQIHVSNDHSSRLIEWLNHNGMSDFFVEQYNIK